MLNKRIKLLLAALFISIFAGNVFAAPQDLSEKYLTRANDALEEDNIEDAYKNINAALKMRKPESSSNSKIVYLAQTIYVMKLEQISDNYDELSFIDIQSNLENYPEVASARIKKVVRQIESKQEEEKQKNAQKQIDEQKKLMEAQNKAMIAQNEAIAKQTEAYKEQAEINKQSSEEMKMVLKQGIEGLGEAFNESAIEQKRSTKVIAIAVISLIVVVLLVILLIMWIVRRGMKSQQMAQEQVAQAFRFLAESQNTTNRIMLGGVTDLYGGNSPLKLAGTSTWAPAQALPPVDFTEEDQEELKKLAVKCEDIGSQIDAITKRKNNSKNVSELVYKLSMELGLSQGMAMLNFCASMIYDAGFLGLDEALLAETDLTPEQREALKEHVNLAEKYLDFVPKKYWSVFEDASLKHHENIDGSGYPHGLKGDEIPQIARLIRVAETYVSMSSRRNYRETLDKETAINKLKEQSNLYDEAVVQALDNII